MATGPKPDAHFRCGRHDTNAGSAWLERRINATITTGGCRWRYSPDADRKCWRHSTVATVCRGRRHSSGASCRGRRDSALTSGGRRWRQSSFTNALRWRGNSPLTTAWWRQRFSSFANAIGRHKALDAFSRHEALDTFGQCKPSVYNAGDTPFNYSSGQSADTFGFGITSILRFFFRVFGRE